MESSPRPLLFLLQLLFFLITEVSNLSNNEFNENENRRYIKEDAASSSDNQNSANHFSDTLPGESQLDYPTYTEIPKTGFSCKGKVNWHYYADIDTECQSFHVCETQYSKISFLCPIGSVFNQRHLVCDWWYNVDCSDSEDLYILRDDLNDQRLSTQLEDGFELSLASSGGNSEENFTSKKRERPGKIKNTS